MSPLAHYFSPRMRRKMASRGVVASSSLLSRIEVCPPELWPSSMTLWGRLRRWLHRNAEWAPASMRPVNRLALVKVEFHHGMHGLDSDDAQRLTEQIERARSLRELWHLRSTLFGLLAVAVNQSEAERRLAALNRHFPMRAPRSSLAPQHA